MVARLLLALAFALCSAGTSLAGRVDNRLRVKRAAVPTSICSINNRPDDSLFILTGKVKGSDASRACLNSNAVLADVRAPIPANLTKVANGCAEAKAGMWVRSWNGDDYGGICLAMYAPNLAIVEMDCEEEFYPLCMRVGPNQPVEYCQPHKSSEERADRIATGLTHSSILWEWDGSSSVPPWVNPQPVVSPEHDEMDMDPGAVVGEEEEAAEAAEEGERIRRSLPALGKLPIKNEPSKSGRTCKIISFDSFTQDVVPQAGANIDVDGLSFYQTAIMSSQSLRSLDADLLARKVIPSTAYGYFTGVASQPNAIKSTDPSRTIIVKAPNGKRFDLNGLYASKVTGINEDVSLFAVGVKHGSTETARADAISATGGLYSLRLVDVESAVIFCRPRISGASAEACAFDDFHVCV